MEVKPTRSELLKVKKQIKLAKVGHGLLKKKRDGLVLEFFELLKQSQSARQEMVNSFITANTMIGEARLLHSDLKLEALALAIKNQPQITLEVKNIMGVRVPKLNQVIQTTDLTQGSGILSSAPSIDRAKRAHQILLQKIVIVAEVETAMKRLLQEIEKTKRRVNALEFYRIPAMHEAKKFITFRLEEMERENVFRLKRIKAKA